MVRGSNVAMMNEPLKMLEFIYLFSSESWGSLVCAMQSIRDDLRSNQYSQRVLCRE
jgi:hypothetical protein